MWWPLWRRRAPRGLGPAGEALAAKFLRRAGHKILAANYRCPAGEVDLITLDAATRRIDGAETICIVEVKTRSSNQYVEPASAVNADKRRRLRKVARYYLATHPAAAGYNVRYDIVSIVMPEGGVPAITHIPGAF